MKNFRSKNIFIHFSSFIIISFFAFKFVFLSNEKTQPAFDSEQVNSKFFPSDYEMLKRSFPLFKYDQNVYKDALNQLNKLKKLKKLSKNQNEEDLTWEFVGPTNIGGRVVDIEFNPNNPNIVYAAAATGGVFKSIDMGVNWLPIFDDQPSLTIGDIGIDPNNPNIIYVGTGEANGGHNNFPGFGVYKSLDAGASWSFMGLDSTVSIGRIIVDPSNSQRVFVASVGSYFQPNPERGVYLSENGGLSWSKSLFISDSTGAIDLAINSQNPNEIYAAMWERVRRPVLKSQTHLYGKSSGIYKSTNGGKSWDKLDSQTGLPNSEVENVGRIGLSISRSNPAIIYSVFTDGEFLTGIYKSINSGANWTKMNSDFPGSGSFGWYFGQVSVQPENPETVFVLDVALLKSSTSGSTWDFNYGYGGPNQLHVDHHALAYHPANPNYIISGNDGGINISIDGGITWSEPVSLPITQFYEIGLDAINPNRFYGGTQDNNTIRTLTGNDNNWSSIYGGDGFYVIVDPKNSNTIYAESQFGELGKSTDGGRNFIGALNGINQNEPTNWSTPVVMDPNNSSVLYYGTHTLYRTEDAASLWKPISNKLTNFTSDTRIGTITTIAVAPSNSNVIYVGTDDGNVWVSKDYGLIWKNISASLPLRWVTRLAVDPKNENRVFITFSGLRWVDPISHVFISENMGESWRDISSNLPEAPVNAFSIDNNNSDILYLGNDIGAFFSKDAGNSWEVLGNNLPTVVVNDMKIHPTENYLAIGTHGRGMYKMDLNPLTSNNSIKNNRPSSFVLYQNYPNPFNPSTTIEYSVPYVETHSHASLQLKIYDVLGREVSTLVNETKSPGTYKVEFEASGLASGIYYYTLATGNYSRTKKMVYLK